MDAICSPGNGAVIQGVDIYQVVDTDGYDLST